MMNCPLCHSHSVAAYSRDRRRAYLQCQECRLVFVEKRFHLSPQREKAEYDLHQNDPGDSDYRRFLNRLAEPLLLHLQPASCGLDFGCGPGPTLSVMLEEAGHRVALFDIFYAADPMVWQQDYDFITATEVVEHLADPCGELARLWRHLRRGGILAIMTKLVRSPEAFARWHYKNDPTHISFFSRHSFEWLANHWRAELKFIGDDVMLLRKTGEAPDQATLLKR